MSSSKTLWRWDGMGSGGLGGGGWDGQGVGAGEGAIRWVGGGNKHGMPLM